MATLTQIRNKANTVLSNLWDGLAIRQESYRLKNDKYFQLLGTAPVVDGENTVMTITSPSDEKFSTDVQFNFASPIPFSVQVDEWGNDTEKGYSMTAVVELLDGRRFKRSRKLTDTRTRTRDVVTEVDGLPTEWGDWYLVGNDPVIETSEWEEVIELDL